MEGRREAVRTSIELLKLYDRTPATRTTRISAGIREIVQAVTIHLSPAAIASLSPSIDRVLLDGETPKETLPAMQLALSNIARVVSPIGQTS